MDDSMPQNCESSASVQRLVEENHFSSVDYWHLFLKFILYLNISILFQIFNFFVDWM